MAGVIALQGGGPFTANDELDAELIGDVTRAGVNGRVVVLPTADAFEHPERLVVAALGWAERLVAAGVAFDVEALMVLRRAEAMEQGAAAVVRDACALYLVGDQPLHLRSVLKDTPLWQAVGDLRARGGLVVGVGASASALCDPMVDPRGGAFTLGLGLVPGLAVVHAVETWSAERLQRTLGMADTPVASLPSGAALVTAAGGWRTIGDVVVRGELPAPPA